LKEVKLVVFESYRYLLSYLIDWARVFNTYYVKDYKLPYKVRVVIVPDWGHFGIFTLGAKNWIFHKLVQRDWEVWGSKPRDHVHLVLSDHDFARYGELGYYDLQLAWSVSGIPDKTELDRRVEAWRRIYPTANRFTLTNFVLNVFYFQVISHELVHVLQRTWSHENNRPFSLALYDHRGPTDRVLDADGNLKYIYAYQKFRV